MNKKHHTWIVAYLLRNDMGILEDHFEVFQIGDQTDPEAEAALRYEALITVPEVYSVTIARAMRSTDYEVGPGTDLTVYVVSWLLFNGGEVTSGGFDWYPTEQTAAAGFDQTRAEFGDESIYLRMVAVPIGSFSLDPASDRGREAITNYLDANPEMYEYPSDPTGIKGQAYNATKVFIQA
jgi:hypothetical protein